MGIVQPFGIASLAITALFASSALKFRGFWRILATGGTVVLCIALGAHLLPGIRNPLLFSGKLSNAATEYRLFWNFDKAIAGLLLLSLVPWRAPIPVVGPRAWRACLGFLALAVLTAVLTGMTRWDPKFSSVLLLWAPANLFLVCIPEEAMFRMLIQSRLEAWLLDRGTQPIFGVYAAAILFGLVHYGGGPLYMAAATMAGVAYGFAYQARRNPWHPVLVHFSLNFVHFLLFAYPF